MQGSSSWQSLRWVMALTVYVALVAIAVRSVAGPVATEGTSIRWSALTLVLAATLFLPAGRAASAVMFQRNIGGERRCPRCSRPELRPLRSSGRGLFDPTHRYRCGACWTGFDQEGEILIERTDPGESASVESPGIWFVEQAGPEPIEPDSGIEFLGEVGPPSRTPTSDGCPLDEGMPNDPSEGEGARRR